MPDIEVTISVTIRREDGRKHTVEDTLVRHVGGNPLFFAREAYTTMDGTGEPIIQMIRDRFGDIDQPIPEGALPKRQRPKIVNNPTDPHSPDNSRD